MYVLDKAAENRELLCFHSLIKRIYSSKKPQNCSTCKEAATLCHRVSTVDLLRVS